MGYNTNLSGRLEIEPPLAWTEFKGSPFGKRGPFDSWTVRLDVTETGQNTADGVVIAYTATGVVPFDGGSIKAYDIVEELQTLVDECPGHEFTGYIEGDGEAPGDVWRLVVRAGRVYRIEPVISWPEPEVTS